MARAAWWAACVWLLGAAAGAWAGAPVTEVEEVIATVAPPDNGAGPLWCYGAPLLVRVGDQVYASVMETGAGVPPLCNTRWRVFRRDDGDDGWRLARHAADFREREPCPLAWAGAGRLVLSVNPSTEPPGTEYGPCDPHLLQLDPRRDEEPPGVVRPAWPGEPRFTDHSYRGLAVDAARGDVLVLNIDAATSAQHWSYLPGGDGAAGAARSGSITFPLRACYPQAAIRDLAAHVMAVGDVVEPNEVWRAYKKEKTGAAWDYVFRRLFYARSPDVAGGDFHVPLEIDTVDATGGHIQNLDLWLDPKGVAHLLYLKTNTTQILRDKFFPGEQITTTLEHVRVEGGVVGGRTTLVSGGEGRPETPLYARYHATADGSLHVVYATRVSDADGSSRVENRLLRVEPARAEQRSIRLELAKPMTTFFTATERGGSPASDVLDLLGAGDGDGHQLRYARVRLGGR